jgi:hypothetical protein
LISFGHPIFIAFPPCGTWSPWDNRDPNLWRCFEFLLALCRVPRSFFDELSQTPQNLS